MPSLASYQTHWMNRLLLSPPAETPPEAWHAWFSKQSQVGLAQYRTMVHSTFEDTLQTIYPWAYRLTEDLWPQILQDYLQAFPPQGFQLLHCAAQFPLFLSQQESLVSQIPFLADLASLELAEAEILNAPTAFPVSVVHKPHIVKTVAGLRRLTFTYPVQSILKTLPSSPSAHEMASWPKQEQVLWGYRTPTQECRFLQVNSLVDAFLLWATSPETANPKTVEAGLRHIQTQTGHPDTTEIEPLYANMMTQLVEMGLLHPASGQ